MPKTFNFKNYTAIMEFKIGDLVYTPNGNGYINDIIDNEVIVDLIDGDDRREMFDVSQIALLQE